MTQISKQWIWERRPEWNRKLLGKLPDSRLAKHWGCTRQRIQQLRKQNGIPAWSKKYPGNMDDYFDAVLEEHALD